MIDWVKGCGLLFPLLHGITEFCVAMVTPNMEIDTIKGTEKNKFLKKLFLLSFLPIVSMDSSLPLLSSCLYMSVAQYIPHLLRQWYLTLDRQSSLTISK